MSGCLRKGRLGNFPRKISMMSNMAENLAKAHLGQRRSGAMVWTRDRRSGVGGRAGAIEAQGRGALQG